VARSAKLPTLFSLLIACDLGVEGRKYLLNMVPACARPSSGSANSAWRTKSARVRFSPILKGERVSSSICLNRIVGLDFCTGGVSGRNEVWLRAPDAASVRNETNPIGAIRLTMTTIALQLCLAT
jgi:hypothetical protein